MGHCLVVYTPMRNHSVTFFGSRGTFDLIHALQYSVVLNGIIRTQFQDIIPIESNIRDLSQTDC